MCVCVCVYVWGELSMRKQCVPGSFLREPGNEATYTPAIQMYCKVGDCGGEGGGNCMSDCIHWPTCPSSFEQWHAEILYF